jgi:hypothetical protein
MYPTGRKNPGAARWIISLGFQLTQLITGTPYHLIGSSLSFNQGHQADLIIDYPIHRPPIISTMTGS